MARLLSINVGLPRDVAWRGRTVHTSVWKEPVAGRRLVRRLDVDGDAQGDLNGHGGEHRAVLVYQLASYRYWEGVLGRNEFTYGQFGENFTVEGLPDDEVCIGDRYRIGGALFEVTQPRVTCYRVGIRMGEPEMAALLVSHRRPGFYLRVLQEGEVGAGDEIVKVADGPEGMTVARIDALLYLPGHPVPDLERALRIPALSAGWKGSFRALLDRAQGAGPPTGNPGLAPEGSPPPAWQGFRAMRVGRVDRESADIASLVLEPADGSPLAVPLPGQFVVLRLHPRAEAPPLLRSYSLSGAPSADRYRVTIKREPNGAGSGYLHGQVVAGSVLEVSAPRGTFTLRAGEGPVVLLGAGVGVTPLLAMLHALAAAGSRREIWWLYGARNRAEHPFAEESRELVRSLPRARLAVRYSRPGPGDRLGVDFDATGHWTAAAVAGPTVPRDAEYYLCGPAGFLRELTAGLLAEGVRRDRIHREVFGPGDSLAPGIAAAPSRPPHPPAGPAGSGPLVSFARSGLTVRWSASCASLLELAEACDVPVKWSCRTGVCHTCECGLVSGSVRYEPEPVDPPADGDLLTCCSRPQTDVIVDL
jgi:ferredoxin-NADP reductase/MOSC domain-containing protein YiiM